MAVRAARKVASILVAGSIAWMLGLASAHAQSVIAVQDSTCAGTRSATNLGCNAGEFTVGATFTAAPGSPAFCNAGESFTFDASLQLSGSNANRYDMGFFVGQAGNSPTLNNAANSCSVAIFPVVPAPFTNLDGDSCGDYLAAGASNPTVQGLKVVCAAATGSNLAVPYTLTYQQNSGGQVCDSAGRQGDPTILPGDVKSTSGSKCNTGSANLEISAVPVQVGGYVDVTKQTTPDGDGQSFSYTATGPAGSSVGVLIDGATTANNTNSITFSLGDGQTARVYMSVVATNRTLTIVEQQATHWQSTAAISCAAVKGSPAIGTNNATRTIQATLNTTNSGAACTVTNTKRARVSLVENVGGRLLGSDQFSLTVAGAGATTLTSDSTGAMIAASAVSVTTSGSATGVYTNATHPSFRATPNLPLSLAHAMAGGSGSTSASYATTLSCTNAFAGPGATTGLPSNAAVSTYILTPQPGDDITCTYTSTPKALLTLAKTVVNDDGRTSVAADWVLSATGPATVSGASGAASVTSVPVPPGTYTLSESGPSGYALTGLSCSGAADGDPSDGLALAEGEIVTCTFTNDDQQVAQTIVKDVLLTDDPDGSGTVTEGDTLTYTVTVTNTGLAALTDVQVSDPELTPGSQSCTSVAIGGTCVLTGTRLVIAADVVAGEIVNTASVESNEIPGPVDSNTLVTPVEEVPPDALEVVKSHSGDFTAGANASYTLQVSNVGSGAISGTTTVEDTLAAGLTYVSASGTGWTCGAAGQVVTCTSGQSVGGFGDMAPITLTVAVAASAGNSVDNAASVGHSTINGGAMLTGNTDTATILHSDLSTSTKTAIDLNGGDVEEGDTLEYRVTLVETAGAVANNVHVTDTLQAGLVGPTVTQVPGGGTDNSTAGQVDVTGITVPASGSVQLIFRVTVGAGFLPGDSIDNTASIDNPGGADATPAAPTFTFAQSQVGTSGNKILYLHDNVSLDRTPQAGTTTTGVLVEASTTEDWTLTPAIPVGETLVLSAGAIGIQLPVDTNFSTVSLQVQLLDGAGGPLIGSSAIQTFATSAVEQRAFAVNLASDYTLLAGDELVLRIINTANGNKHARVYEFNGSAATIAFATSTVVNVDSVQAYSQAYAAGNTQQAHYLPGDSLWVRAVASDPFGGDDVSSASVTITDANGAVMAGPAAMTSVDITAGNRTFEYPFTVPALAALGVWTATVTAHEGTEGTVQHTAAGTFELRGRVTLDQVWGPGAIAGDAVSLQVTGGSDAVDGSSTAPSAATPATAFASASSSISLAQAFTVGNASGYTISLSCVRDADGAALATTGSGQTRQVQMPLDSSITCTWTDSATVALTVVKVSSVKSDPINGTSTPKAIPGAIVEYQLILTNPAATPIDSGSVVVSDPLPDYIVLRVADIAGANSGPVLFTDGAPSSGLSYSFSALSSGTDDVAFSSDGGATWTYTPVPDAEGFDAGVNAIRINPQGAFAGNNAQFTLRFRVRIQ